MGIDAIVESTEGMDQSIASLYTQDAATGKWRLDVNGGFKLPSEIEGLSSALGKERSRAEAAEKALKALQGKLDGFDVDAGRAALEKVSRMTEDQKAREAQFEQNVQQRLNPVLKERDELAAEVKDYKAKIETMLIDKALSESAFLREKVSKDPVHQSYVREHFRANFRVEDGQVVAYDAPNGQKLFGSDGQPCNVDAALSRLVNASPIGSSLLAGSQTSGSGASASSQGWTGQKTMKRSQFDQLDPAAKMKTIQSGTRITD